MGHSANKVIDANSMTFRIATVSCNLIETR